jgi:endonuclease/exonuclease/phosphatase family metal-dependent hydrolase
MTLNLHRGTDESGTNQLAADLALFNTERPDLIALQEVESGHLKTFMSAGYQVIFGPNLNLTPFHFGNVILTRRPILYHHHYYLPSQLEPRGLDEVALEIDGQIITILNTHLGLEMPERVRQFAEIQRILNYLSGPMILLGDFNAEPDDELFAGFQDHFWEIGAGTPGAKTFPSSRPVKRFDQIWYNDFWELLKGGVLPWLGSDHLPVLAELKLVKGNPTPQVKEPSISGLPQNNSTLSDSLARLADFDSPEIQVGIEAGLEMKYNQRWAEVSFPFNRHGIIGAQYCISSESPDSGVTVFRLGYSPGSFDLRDYFSLVHVKGYGRWIFYGCADTENALWMELNQVYRWSPRWETDLTLAFKNPKTTWRFKQSFYFTNYLSFSLGIGAKNNVSSSLTYIPP